MTTALTRHTRALSRVRHPGYSFFIQGDFSRDTQPCYLQARFMAPCSRTGEQQPQLTRKWQLSEHMTPSEIVQTAFKCVLTSIEHEAREQFTYDDAPIFGPHFDIDDLGALCHRGKATAGGRHP